MIGLLLAGVMPPRPRPQTSAQTIDQRTDEPPRSAPPPAWWHVEQRVLAALAEHTHETDPWTAALTLFDEHPPRAPHTPLEAPK